MEVDLDPTFFIFMLGQEKLLSFSFIIARFLHRNPHNALIIQFLKLFKTTFEEETKWKFFCDELVGMIQCCV